MRNILRAIVGLVGVFNVIIGVGFLLSPEKLAQAFYIAPLGVQGLATIRADFPGFFIGAATFALIGAWTSQARPLLVPMLMLALALFGRFVSIIFDGTAATTAPPMIAEAVMIGILYFGWRNFEKPNA